MANLQTYNALNLSTATFSGADIICSITVPLATNDIANGPLQLATAPTIVGGLDTISISTHRDSVPVRNCGGSSANRANPKGFTRGPRTIAGSLIFKMFDVESLYAVQHQVQEFYQAASTKYAAYYSNAQIASLIPYLNVDELPPFDVTITLANESGMAAVEKIFGVQIITNGHIAGINDLYMEEQMSYCALGHSTLRPGFSNNGSVLIA
jgi:hypothetical protein